MAVLTMLVSWKELRTVECTPSRVILPIAAGNGAILWITLRFWDMVYRHIKRCRLLGRHHIHYEELYYYRVSLLALLEYI